MRTLNRITKVISILVILLIIIGIIAALYGIYFYFPALREDIRRDTSNAVAKWFPGDSDTKFSYQIAIDLKNDKCLIKDLVVTDGTGKVLDAMSMFEYRVDADTSELDLGPLVKRQPLTLTGLKGFRLYGHIEARELRSYFTPENSGMQIKDMAYDDFTEKTIIDAVIVEVQGIDVLISGRWKIDADGNLTLTDRSYRNPDSPVGADIVKFIEAHTDPTIRFTIFNIPLKVADFTFDGMSLTVELERE